MRAIGKWIVRVLLALLLGVLLIAATLPWWAPEVADEAANRPLEIAGFDERRWRLSELDWDRLDLAIERLSHSGVTVDDAEIQVGFALAGLWGGMLERIVVEGAAIEVDLPAVLAAMPPPGSGPSAGGAGPPERIPLESLSVRDAAITVTDASWTRTFGFEGQAQFGDVVWARAGIDGSGAEWKARAYADWPGLTGRARSTLRLSAVDEWLAFAREGGWLSWPENASVEAGDLALTADARLEERALGEWEADLDVTALGLRQAPARLEVAEGRLGARGSGEEVRRIFADLDTGEFGYEPFNLAFGRIWASTIGSKRLTLQLSDWELSGRTPMASLGDFSLEAGKAELNVNGDWKVWEAPLDPAGISARLVVEPAPFDFFSGMGSVSGELFLDAGVTAGETRFFTAMADLIDADVALAAGGLTGERVELRVNGAAPDALTARVGLTAANLNWGGGKGRLNQVDGAIQLASLMPLKTDGTRTLTFESLEQGEVALGAGEMALDYEAGRESPLDLTFTLAGLDGEVTVSVRGDPQPPFRLNLEAQFDRVQLQEIADLLPDFDGSVTGEVSGKLAMGLDGKRIILKPGGLRLTPGTTGRFQYTKQGWLTQDPNLNPETFVRGKDLVTVMKDPQGAMVVTELALRDLKMTGFSFEMLPAGSGGKRAVVKIEGEGAVKGVAVPVVVDVPIRGELKEYINVILGIYDNL